MKNHSDTSVSSPVDKVQHTPGLWYVEGTNPPRIYANEGMDIICQCDSAGEMSKKQELANARLIAAAPELLEALQTVSKGFADGSIKFTKKRQADNDPYHPANVLMCTALAKATQ